MPFPLPVDTTFRKEIITCWLEDVEDRLSLGRLEEAKYSLRVAKSLYLSLPAGAMDSELESSIVSAGVKLSKHT